MLGIYLSGTGNTEHCVTRLVKLIDASADRVPLEDESVTDKIKGMKRLSWDIRRSFRMHHMIRDFIQTHASLWKVKGKMICVATMGAFSGDGAGCAARLLKNTEQ